MLMRAHARSGARPWPLWSSASRRVDLRLRRVEGSSALRSIRFIRSIRPIRFIRSIRFKNFKGAAKTIRQNNILGATCAEICPQERVS